MPGGPREVDTGLPGATHVVAAPDDGLQLDTDVRRACSLHAQMHVPREACGLLLWAGSRATAYVPAVNVLPAADARLAFELHLPAAMWAELLAAERAGGAQVGLCHSHVRGGAHPSVADLVELDPDMYGRPYVVYSVRDDAWWLGRIGVGT